MLLPKFLDYRVTLNSSVLKIIKAILFPRCLNKNLNEYRYFQVKRCVISYELAVTKILMLKKIHEYKVNDCFSPEYDIFKETGLAKWSYNLSTQSCLHLNFSSF